MRLKANCLGALALACAAFLAVALPTTHTSAQATDDSAISAERKAERFRIGRAILDLIPRIGEEREREVSYLRRRFTSGLAREEVDTLIALIEDVENGDPRAMYETALRLRDGQGFPRHWRAGLTWLERAGDHGVLEAYVAAAHMMLDEPDPGYKWEGESLLKRAARYGLAAAQKEVATRELARFGKNESYGNRPYAWLLLAEANGAEVSDAEFAAARDNLSKERRKDTRAIVQLALDQSRLPRFWPSVRESDPAEILKEDLRAALRWHECGGALSIIGDARQAGIAAADRDFRALDWKGTCFD